MYDHFGIKLDIEMVFEGDDLAVQRVANSQSWSLLPDVVIEAHPQLVCSLAAPSDWDAPYTISAIFLQHREQNPVIQSLLAALKGKINT